MTKVSVIIPCYNQEKYIADCLESVLAQTFDDYEAIVIDDGSTDNSISIVKEYQKKSDKIRLIQQKNQGVVTARNNAIKQARGKYIYPLDADDIAHRDVLRKSFEAIESGKGDIISCKYQGFTKSDELKQQRSLRKFVPPSKVNMILGCCIANSSLYRKSDFEKCGGYDRAFDKGWEDYDLWLNLILRHNLKIYRIDEVLFFFRIKNIDESRNTQADTYHKCHLTITLIKKYPILLVVKIIHKLFSFFFQKKITRNGNLIVKICKIPLFRKKLNNAITLMYYTEDINFGDMLNVDLFAELANTTVINTDSKNCEIVAIGSLLQVLLNKKNNKQKSKKSIIVYGSGFIEPPKKDDFFIRPLDVRAVRGYLSLERLKKSKQAYISKNVAVGDPALLIPKIFDVSNIKKKYKLGIIPHYVDKDNPLLNKINVKNSIILDVTDNTKDFVNKLASCEAIISSAMHGLIAADSLLIPNVRMILSDKITGGDYKFDDYYSAFGIRNHNKVNLNEQGFNENDLVNLHQTYFTDKEKLTKIQDDLINAFPYKRII